MENPICCRQERRSVSCGSMWLLQAAAPYYTAHSKLQSFRGLGEGRVTWRYVMPVLRYLRKRRTSVIFSRIVIGHFVRILLRAFRNTEYKEDFELPRGWVITRACVEWPKWSTNRRIPVAISADDTTPIYIYGELINYAVNRLAVTHKTLLTHFL